ncbi:MAG: sporulation protein YabP [Ruminococcaceae bacterium]|nr:sporulation protein YabP [Oscillospiraceae bacterium]
MCMDETKRTAKAHSISLKERKSMTLTGVSEIISFDESCVSLDVSDHQLNIYGSSLHIDSFSNDSGDVAVSGIIDSIVYSGKTQASYRKGILKRLFSYDEQ